MSFTATYKQLFEVQLFHNYFLNDGTSTFSLMNDSDKKKQLKLYDSHGLFDIIPTQDSILKMAGHKIFFKIHKSGFSAYCKITDGTANTPFIVLPDDLKLKFVLKTKDNLFGNYTDLKASGSNVFYFGNTKPSTEGASFEYIAKSNQNKLVTDAHQISTTGSTAMIDNLKGSNSIGVFGIVQLNMIGDTADLSILTAQGKLKNQLPTFKIHFNNRESFWRYKNASDDTEIFTTATTNPLTKFGFVEVTHNGDKFPNPNANHLIPDNNNFFSEIYI